MVVQTQSGGQDDDNVHFTGNAETETLFIDAGSDTVFRVDLQNGGRKLFLTYEAENNNFNLKSVELA